MRTRGRSPFFDLFTTLTTDDRVYRGLVLPAQRLELLVSRLGLRRRRSLPPLEKRRLLADAARRRRVRNFVETGTYLGDTAYELSRVVEHVYTIELDPGLQTRAEQRFGSIPNVTVLRGDSAEVLPALLPTLEGPTLFWLDAHYSGGVTARGPEPSAAREELAAILAHWTPGSAVLIDDAHCFVGRDGYLSVKTIGRLVRASEAELELRIADDVIRVEPSTRAGRSRTSRRARSRPGGSARAARAGAASERSRRSPRA